MAKIGEKRSVEGEVKEQDESKLTTPSPSAGLSLMFKPSPLANVASTLTTYNRAGSEGEGFKKFQKFNFSEPNEGVKSPVKFTGPAIMKASTPRSMDNGRGSFLKRPLNGSSEDDVPSKKSNLFIDCLSQSSSKQQDDQQQQPSDKGFLFGEQLSSRVVCQSAPTSSKTLSREESATDESLKAGGVASASPTSLILPTVETVTGEEGERHVTQISCSLFVFDSASHSWKERGRGELRLNDTPKSEGAYQSRLIMRTTGSRRVCLNTHMWSTMKCERANKRSIRITAQETDGFGIYLIKGASKDISNLFAAISRRLDALKIASSRGDSQSSDCEPRPSQLPSTGGFDEDDSVLGDRPSSVCSSPESSPERPTERLEKPVSAAVTTYSSSPNSSLVDSSCPPASPGYHAPPTFTSSTDSTISFTSSTNSESTTANRKN